MAKIISILNQKGGVGKTTSTFNIASVLSQKGNRVLMVDCDSQASLTLMTGNDPLALNNSVVNIFEGSKKINECIYKLPIKNLHIIPSNLGLAKTETILMSATLGRESKLKNAIDAVKHEYDYILVDCPPALSLLTINSLIASDYVVAPCETSTLSLYALDDLRDTIEEVQQININLKFMGVIATRFNMITKLDKSCLDELMNNYNVIGIVKNSVKARDGIEEGLPVVLKNKGCSVAKSYVQITEKIMEEI